jgi:hypothetical protein
VKSPGHPLARQAALWLVVIGLAGCNTVVSPTPTAAATLAPALSTGSMSPSNSPETSAIAPTAKPAKAPASAAPTAQATPARPIPVPSDLKPPLADAMTDAPVIYSNGCHLNFPQTVPPPCTFGDLKSHTTVVLFGDSKAGQWFPALQALAVKHHWRLVSMTKSACPAVDITPWNSARGRAYRECDAWRRNVIRRIASEHPALVVISDDRLYQLAIRGGPVPAAKAQSAWNAGLQRTLRAAMANAASVLLIGDTPRARSDPATCLARHLSNLMACATPLKVAIDLARLRADDRAASTTGARFLDPTAWVCSSDPCPPIIGHTLLYREQDHLTATFVLQLAARLDLALGLP